MTLAKKRYQYQMYAAKKRNISFELTFDEWYNWWLSNGVDKNATPLSINRQQKDELCMCRKDDKGSYTLSNIYCATRSQNTLDGIKAGGIKIPGHNKKIIVTPIGKFESLTAAAKAYNRDVTTIGYRLKRYPKEYYYNPTQE